MDTMSANMWRSSERVLAEFDRNGDSALDSTEFRGLCVGLFGEEQVVTHGDLVLKLFVIFAGAGISELRGEDWDRCFQEWVRVVVEPVAVLIVVDMQNDFIDGSLALRRDGDADIIGPINRLIQDCPWQKIVYSLDWHPPDHVSFYDNLHLRPLDSRSLVDQDKAQLFDTVWFSGSPVEQKLWPVHCVQGTWGAQLNKDLLVVPDAIKILKGTHPDRDSYSAFFDNGRQLGSGEKVESELETALEALGVTDIYACGLALDVCVAATSLDALSLGYRVAVIDNCCLGVSPAGMDNARQIIRERGGLVLQEEEVPALVRGERRSLLMAYQGAQRLKAKN